MLIKQEIPEQYICSSTAKLDYAQYAMKDVPEDPYEFELWKLEYLKKYPLILKSHQTLWECYSHYKAKEDQKLKDFTSKKGAP